jgi:hypothetical protein
MHSGHNLVEVEVDDEVEVVQKPLQLPQREQSQHEELLHEQL